MHEDDEWMGAVQRSALDNRCWFAVIPGTDIMTSEGHCSSSVRKVKAYVMDQVCRLQHVTAEQVVWVRDSDESWTLVERNLDCRAVGFSGEGRCIEPALPGSRLCAEHAVRAGVSHG